MTVSWRGGCRAWRARPGVSSMRLALLIAGIASLSGGPPCGRCLASRQGVQPRQHVHNRRHGWRLLRNVTGSASGVVVAELKGIAAPAGRIGRAGREVRVRPVPPGLAVRWRASRPSRPGIGDANRSHQPAAGPPPWQSEAAARERPRAEPPPEPEAPTPPAAPKRRARNLLFASSSRKERERAEAKADESLPRLSRMPSPRSRPAPGESAARELRRCLAEAGPYAATGTAAAARRPPPRSPSTFAEPGPPPPAPNRRRRESSRR